MSPEKSRPLLTRRASRWRLVGAVGGRKRSGANFHSAARPQTGGMTGLTPVAPSNRPDAGLPCLRGPGQDVKRANKKGEGGGVGESQSSRNARLVCKWVLIDAFSPFVCLMEKHFSLNCHSQVGAARVSAGPDKGGKGGRQTGGRTERVIRIQCEGGEWKGCEGGRGAAEQTITTISVPFKKRFPPEPFDIEMRQSLSAGGCGGISLTKP